MLTARPFRFGDHLVRGGCGVAAPTWQEATGALGHGDELLTRHY
jgi:hypothetical protein